MNLVTGSPLIPLLNESILYLGAKRTMLIKAKDQIDSIVIGSSHGDFGFDPSYFPNSFNLCCRSQDLKYSFHLYKHVSDICPNIRNVVVFYSVFLPGNLMERSPSEKDICPALNELFNLGLEYEDDKLAALAGAIKGKLDAYSVELEGTRGFIPNMGKAFFPPSYGATRRAHDHLLLNKNDEANGYLTKILMFAKRQAHKVCIVIPPVRSDYRMAIGDAATLFKPLFEILHDPDLNFEIELLNCFGDDRFVDAHFGDFDHLHPSGEGTKILSRLICDVFAAPAAHKTNAANELSPQDHRFRDAMAHHQAGRLAEAGAIYMAILESNPDHPEANHNLGRIAVQAEQPAAGLPYFVAVLNADPTNRLCWLEYIDALLLAGQRDEAQGTLALARQHGLEGSDVDALAARIKECAPKQAANGRNSRQTAALGKHTARGGEPGRKEIDAVMALFNQRRFDEVTPLARKLTAHFPQHDFGWKVLGSVLKVLGRSSEALAPMRKAVELAPHDIESRHNLGVILQELGELDEAAASYRQALKINADYVDSVLNLGVVLHKIGHLDEAVEKHQQALRLRPNSAPGHGNLGATLMALGRPSEAEGSFRCAITLMPEDALAHNNLGIALKQMERLDEAVASFQKALTISPEYAEAHLNLGTTFQKLGRLDEAQASLDHALRINPDEARAHNNLAALFQELGHLDEADAHFQIALLIKPDDAEILGNQANFLSHMRRWNAATDCYQRALAKSPDDAQLHARLGDVHRFQRNFAGAEACYKRSLQLEPDNLDRLFTLGLALRHLGALHEAEAIFRKILRIKPDSVVAMCELGLILLSLGQLGEAEDSLRKALDRQPGAAILHSNLLFFLLHAGTKDNHAVFLEHARFGQQFETPLRQFWSEHTQDKDPERDLRIGFVSADFYNHAVASFIEPTLAQLADYPQLKLYAYYNDSIEDLITQRLRGYFAKWTPISDQQDADVAEQIRADGIDILIDLSGHTAGNRLLVFARKPAPIQASWIGYPGSTGLRAVDYYMADRFMLPPGQLDDQFTECIVRLPAISPFQLHEGAPPVNDLPALQLGYMTFGSFNRLDKLSRDVIALWARILRKLPDARMVLGGLPNAGSCNPLIDWFAAEGIVRDRLTLHPRAGMEAYMALHHQVDLCLDTFPYNGGTTTHHALWMGVPTLTLAGDSMPGRVGAANLGHVGLERFIAENAEDFVAQGQYWNSHLTELAELRAGMRDRLLQSPLRRPELLAMSLYQALRSMWQRWCAGLPPESFEIDLPDSQVAKGGLRS